MFALLYGMYAAARDYVREHMTEEAVQIHEDRNHNQQDLLLDELPQQSPHFDPQSGMTWVYDNPIGETTLHQNNECVSATVTPAMHEQLNNSPQYQHELETLQSALNLTDTDPHSIVPGPQVCFDSVTGERVDSGPGAGTWNMASPLVPGQSDEHIALDMAPHLASDQYTAYPPPAEHDSHSDQPTDDSSADHHDHWDGGGYGHEATADSD